ncbi:hydrolase [Streptococcus varani]|uniref:Hydrolase n=1 Tax=Streptococcus varani TaxID=1608583 RepID=A0A0E4H4E2_9STRE|nr:Cof-type HAD-IIB family hydrolase [Streptococcus varani]CQR24178.1 hydrolase [Streptococcus varani]
MNSIKMVATDLDGTLLNSQLELSKTNCTALENLKSRGIHVVLCTGRPFKGMQHLIDQIGLDDQDYTVSYNGSLVQSCDGKQILHQADLAPKSFARISHFFAQFGLGTHAMTMDKMYTYNYQVHPLTVRESYLGNLPLTVLNPKSYVSEPIIKIMAVGQKEDLDKAIQLFSSAFGDLFSINKSEDFYLEIMQKGDNKAKALKLLLDELQLGQENLLAFGNNLNDLELLKFARIGVAVGNAVPALKEESDYITESNDQDGVARFLQNYCA